MDVVLSFVFTLFLSTDAQASTFEAPKLFFGYSWLYDSNCAAGVNRKIAPEWAREARARTAEFERIWAESGPSLFKIVFDKFQRGFKRKELTASLSVCQAPSISNPLVLNVSRFLRSYMGEKPAHPDEIFADLVFHELLHTWLVNNFSFQSPLLDKYRSEERTVRSHLHLLAIQHLVYTDLNRPDILARVQQSYRSSRNPSYARTLQIVELEGFQKFIDELANEFALDQVELVPVDVAPDRERVTFSHQIRTCLSREVLWTEFSRALVDSETSRLWPNAQSRVKGHAELGARIAVTYGRGLFAPTYGYTLDALVENTGFVYKADTRHPFVGGAKVRLTGTSIEWDGAYDILKSDGLSREFFARFAPAFFGELEQKVRALESNFCKVQ